MEGEGDVGGPSEPKISRTEIIAPSATNQTPAVASNDDNQTTAGVASQLSPSQNGLGESTNNNGSNTAETDANPQAGCSSSEPASNGESRSPSQASCSSNSPALNAIQGHGEEALTNTLANAIHWRETYRSISSSRNDNFASRFLLDDPSLMMQVEKESIETLERVPGPPPKGTHWNIVVPEKVDYICQIQEGIIRVFADIDAMTKNVSLFPFSSYPIYVDHMRQLQKMMENGKLKYFCKTRLDGLYDKFKIHFRENEQNELQEQCNTARIDFTCVRMVDCHVHAAAAISKQKLVDLIKSKAEKHGDKELYKDENDVKITLNSILGGPWQDLTTDSLKVEPDSTIYEDFDAFKNKFNIGGKPNLRNLFLRFDNIQKGEYFADVLKEVFRNMEKYPTHSMELRLTITGKDQKEWENMANWIADYDLYCHNVRWVIQLPRAYHRLHNHNNLKSFQNMLENVYMPLFDATLNPGKYINLHKFLHYVIGFDSVDNEGHMENSFADENVITPDKWNTGEKPVYMYVLYYMWANLYVLNQLRRERGLKTFALKPHCGEAGSPLHLATGFLLADNICHALELARNPVLEYLYYLTGIGISMSPISNSRLYKKHSHPIKKFLRRGLNVTATSDDPLIFHMTECALLEEYTTLYHSLPLNNVDYCELAKNSVLICGFEDEIKSKWIGPNYVNTGVAQNDINRTNVPYTRVAYRYDRLVEELMLLKNHS